LRGSCRIGWKLGKREAGSWLAIDVVAGGEKVGMCGALDGGSGATGDGVIGGGPGLNVDAPC
jgi:hypothetical protein